MRNSKGVVVIKPLSLLNQKINSNVLVELKGGRGYRGILDGYDPHMNLVLRNAEELLNNEVKRRLEVTIVRGDNVIYISP
jgi:small nuclear ribonucleoprotein